ncbi:phosphotransferase [Haloprofundus halobius]|uniref:phosphotransferase n=1 Tax=Haloprofundus halobius TaxID=2876194 RepID=UPI001CCFA70E|nr:phosphotransferase [Haloprofundus halobius]
MTKQPQFPTEQVCRLVETLQRQEDPTSSIPFEPILDLSEMLPRSENESSFPNDAYRELYDVRRETWRHLVSDTIRGRCLDLFAGYGSRAFLLNELADEVYAVEPRADALEILKSRIAARNEAVTPVQGDGRSLPFRPGFFQTIVVDLAAVKTSPSHAALFERLSTLLSDDGALVAILNGVTDYRPNWESVTASRLFAQNSTESSRTGATRTRRTAYEYEKLFRSTGFHDVEFYGLLPNSQLPELVFDVADTEAVDRCIDFAPGRAKRLLARGLQRVGALKHLYPNYVAVCRKEPRENRNETERKSGRLLWSGQLRSTMLTFEDGELQRIRKIPHGKKFETTTRNENEVIEELTRRSCVEGLPSGGPEPSPFGESRVEAPASGKRLCDYLERDPEQFEYVLDLGFDWVIPFHRRCRERTLTKSPREVESDLDCPIVDASPPTVSEPLTLFEGPLHGDYAPHNVFVEDGRVSTVIDWEYSAQSGLPIADAGSFLLTTCMQTFGGLEPALEHVFASPNEYTDAVRDTVSRYCDALDIELETFIVYLPYTWVRILNMFPETQWMKLGGQHPGLVWENGDRIRQQLR